MQMARTMASVAGAPGHNEKEAGNLPGLQLKPKTDDA
jgi:hypothetical protein